MKSASKTSKASKPVKKSVSKKVHKDGYGAHWHAVGWIAAIAIVLSASTMTLSASAQSTPITPSVLLRSVNNVQAQLDSMEQKIDDLNQKVSDLSQ